VRIRRIKLEQELRRALGSGQLELRYQPIVSLRDREVAGFEALLRWRHPERGVIPPLSFIPLAEESGLIEPMGLWVLEEVCGAIAELSADGSGSAPYVTVNLSPRQLVDARWSERLPDILDSRSTRHREARADQGSPSSSSTATVMASTPAVTDGSGSILKKGEWWEGTGGPPASSASRSACAVPPTEK